MPLQSFTPTEVTLTERRRLEVPLLAMIWVSAAASGVALGNWFDVGAGTLAVAVNLVAVLHWREVYVRKLLVNASVIAATVALVLELAGQPGRALSSLQHYLVLIMLCKLFERKGNRDYVQMLAMSVLLMVAASLGQAQLWFAIALVVYMGLCTYVATVFTLKRGLDAAATAQLSNERRPLAPQQVSWNVIRNWPARALVWRVSVMLTAMLVLGAIVFLAAPRGKVAESAGLGSPESNSSTTGFTNTVHLGDSREVYQSDKIAMRVRVRGLLAGTKPPREQIYLRGKVYDTYGLYMRSSWSCSSSSAMSTVWPPLDDEVKSDCYVQEITMPQTLLPTMFCAWPVVHAQGQTLARTADGLLNFEWSPPDTAGPSVRYEVCSIRSDAAVRHVEFLSAMRQRLGERMIDPQRGVHVEPEVEQLARQWCQDLLEERRTLEGREMSPADAAGRDGLDLAIAERLSRRLKERCSYTLDLREADAGRDGVEDFLFHTRKGHCEYFASALTVMCRSLGVQARLATGFVAPPAGSDGVSIVRERDAHAWTEVFTPSTDWTIFDATPGSSLASARTRSWWGSVGDWFSELQFTWNDKFVGYDALARNRVWAAVVGLWESTKSALKQAWRDVSDSAMRLLVRGEMDVVMQVVVAAIALAALAAEAMLVRRMVQRMRLRRRARLTGGAWWELAFIPRLIERLERLGASGGTLPASQTLRRAGKPALGLGVESPGGGGTLRERALAAVRADVPASELTALVELYYSVRWGGRRVAEDEIRRAKCSAERLVRRAKRQKSMSAEVARV